MNKRKKVAVVGLGGIAGVGILATAAEAHNGDVSVSQSCNGWEGTVTLNHNVTVDRTVAVSTNIPGVWGITGHYDRSAGQIWHRSGNGNVHGYVRLDIWRPNGSLEFTESKQLNGVEGCVVPTTRPTPTTVLRQETTTTTTVPVTTTTVTRNVSVPPISQSCEEDMACWNCHTMGNKVCGTTTTSTTVATLPHTGAAGTGISVGVGVVFLAVGVLIWKKVGSKLASVRG